MDFEQAKRFIEGPAPEIHLGLDRLQTLLLLLGSPEKKIPCVHLAGSNGKGSTLACISAMLQEAGLRTGRFFSPALKNPLERFQVNGRQISRQQYTALAEKIRLACEQMEKEGAALPSAFEKETALAFLHFAAEQCQIIVLECGMGGRLDATNVIPAPEAAVILPVSLEHRAFLGSTLTEIAGEKAGIIKEGCSVITAPQPVEVMEVLREKCRACGAELFCTEQEKISLLEASPAGIRIAYEGQELAAPLAGLYQQTNIAAAWLCCQTLKKRGWPLSDDLLLQGLAKAVWPGRFQRIGRQPDLILDGAHNPAGIRELTATLQAYYPGKKCIFLMGVFRDKDHPAMLRQLLPLAEAFYLFDLPWLERSLPAADLAEEIRQVGGEQIREEQIHICPSAEVALAEAKAVAGPEDLIVACGSLSYLGRLIP